MEVMPLDWDSGFFGFKVARILPEELNHEQLQIILAGLTDNEVKLAYWSTNKHQMT